MVVKHGPVPIEKIWTVKRLESIIERLNCEDEKIHSAIECYESLLEKLKKKLREKAREGE